MTKSEGSDWAEEEEAEEEEVEAAGVFPVVPVRPEVFPAGAAEAEVRAGEAASAGAAVWGKAEAPDGEELREVLDRVWLLAAAAGPLGLAADRQLRRRHLECARRGPGPGGFCPVLMDMEVPADTAVWGDMAAWADMAVEHGDRRAAEAAA